MIKNIISNLIFAFIISSVLSTHTFAAEVKNVVATQAGNRVLFEFEVTGEANEEADVNVTVTINGTDYNADKLHLEGDCGKVKTGKGNSQRIHRCIIISTRKSQNGKSG